MVIGSLLILFAGVQWWAGSVLSTEEVTRPWLIGAVVSVLGGVAIIAMALIRHRRLKARTLRSLIRHTTWVVIVSVLVQLVGASVLATGITQALRSLGVQGSLGPGPVLLILMLVVHSAAAVVVPWTVREACVPPVVWAVMMTVASLTIGNDSLAFFLTGVALALLSGVPGIALSYFRDSRFRAALGQRLIGARYAEIQRELHFARRVHERLFPRPVRQGPVRLEYAYEPMRQIGGDFLDVSSIADGSLVAVMIDVTGHGVAAALAVNRLHGELKRLLAESQDRTPAEIMTSINSYVHLTLADESIFATAVAARVWPDGRVRLSVAGHPPPLLRAADGAVSSIAPTAAMLGPFPPADFQADEIELRLPPGAALVLYTDGAIECRDAGGRALGQPALEDIVSKATAPDTVLERIKAFAADHAEDDVLVATISLAGS